MVPRIHVPALALLGLQFTGCDSGPGADADPIVGTWEVIEIDGSPFPDEGEDISITVEISSENAGEYRYAYSYEGEPDTERTRPITIDASAAPRYALTFGNSSDGNGGFLTHCDLKGDELNCSEPEADVGIQVSRLKRKG